ncbi:hypothetical protein [Burkholderia sp. BCC1644]|uniref:hypothetical protein n=1 Tax=Burkholderia sp. BCC1644 TaxID=2676293 RepID=UPI00158FF8DB|nr:hypothetical protein [Burkholderia sp. BCC1644]
MGTHVDRARQADRCTARIAIQSQLRRFDMTSINACASARFAVRMKPPTPMREIVHSSIDRARRSAAIDLRPMPFRKLPQTNDRFKRRAG